jgi:hypothetical protein
MKITTRAWTGGVAAALVIGAGMAAAWAAEPPAETPGVYTRVAQKDDGTEVLEIASKTFAPADGKGPKIHLVGAVHIADKPFYTTLQKMLDAADLVLFEGVKPPGAGTFDATLDDAGKAKATKARLKFLLSVVEDDRSRTGKLPVSMEQAVDDAGKRWKTMISSSLTDAWGHAIKYAVTETDDGAQKAVVTSFGPDGADNDGQGDDVRLEGKNAPKKKVAKETGLQAQMADALGLRFQLDEMDSSKPNWRSSDMSVDQLQARFEAAGVEGDQLFKMLDGSSFMGKLASLAMSIIKSNPQFAAATKLTLLDTLGGDDAMAAAMGPAGMKKMMDVILKDRNDVVLQDIRAVLDKEQPARKDIAVFYGAGHLKDMEAKLKQDFGYSFEKEEWLEAISVAPKDLGLTPEAAKKAYEQKQKQAEAAKARAEKAKQKKKEREEAKKKEEAEKKDATPAPAEK